jgi:hypothetical protein
MRMEQPYKEKKIKAQLPANHTLKDKIKKNNFKQGLKK